MTTSDKQAMPTIGVPVVGGIVGLAATRPLGRGRRHARRVGGCDAGSDPAVNDRAREPKGNLAFSFEDSTEFENHISLISEPFATIEPAEKPQ